MSSTLLVLLLFYLEPLRQSSADLQIEKENNNYYNNNNNNNDNNNKENDNNIMMIISNSNWTEWSTIQGVIVRVISKSDESEVRGRFEITSTSYRFRLRARLLFELYGTKSSY